MTEKPKNTRIQYYTAADIEEHEYHVLDFQGEWLQFFGQPEGKFVAIIHGKPGGGKSTFAMQFAQYLAENFGPVLYNQREEGRSLTLKKKIIATGARSKNLTWVVLDNPEDLFRAFKNKRASYLFIDSAQMCDFTPEDLNAFKKRYRRHKNKGIVIVLKSEKSGQYRGPSDWGHDTDIIVSVENGVATTTKCRFGTVGMRKVVYSTSKDLFNQPSHE